MESQALVYSENEFGKVDGKVANGLVRHSEKFDVVGIIDSTKTGLDAGEVLDGVKNDIPIFQNVYGAIANLKQIPQYFIYGIAPLTAFIGGEDREVIFTAMKMGMHIVNGMPEFLSEDAEFVRKASEFGVKLYDIRKPPKTKDLRTFSGEIRKVKAPVVAVLGTDCAVGKRTTAVKLVEALRNEGMKVVFVATGQTGLLQGAKYGYAIDVLSSGFASGAVEHAIVAAYENEDPDIIIVEGQGALSHPAFTSTSAIIRGAMPDAIIVQHPPKRKMRCDFPDFKMPALASEIELLELFSQSKVIGITLNHEGMTDAELDIEILECELKHKIPVTDVLKQGCSKLVAELSRLLPLPLNTK